MAKTPDGHVVPRRNSLRDLAIIMGMGLSGVALALLIPWLVAERQATVTDGALSQDASREASRSPQSDMRNASDRIRSLEDAIHQHTQQLAAVRNDIVNLQRQQASLSQAVSIPSGVSASDQRLQSEKTQTSGAITNLPASKDDLKRQEALSGQAQRELIERTISDLDTNITILQNKLSAQREEYDRRLADAKAEDANGGGGRPRGRGPVYRSLAKNAENALKAVEDTERQLRLAMEYKDNLLKTRDGLSTHP